MSSTAIRHRRAILTQRSPDRFEGQRIAEIAQERCGICTMLYPASVMIDEDGRRRCPDCRDTTTIDRQASIQASDAAYVAARPTRPQISQTPLAPPRRAFVRAIQTATGSPITQSAPLTLMRGVATVVKLAGNHFSTTDAITYTSGISDSAPVSRTLTTTTLTIVADAGMTPTDHAELTFNGKVFRGRFRVR